MADKDTTKEDAVAAKPVRKAAPKAKKTTVRKSAKAKKPVKKIDIGVDVRTPVKTCDDQFCPFHGILPVRGQILEGEVVSDRMQKTVVVQRQFQRKIEKYERLEKRFRKYLAHNPPCLDIKVNDRVKIMECRPLSKTVSFVVIEKMS